MSVAAEDEFEFELYLCQSDMQAGVPFHKLSLSV